MQRNDYSTDRRKKQTIYKIIKRDPGYSQIPNDILRDTRTSWRAKGILATLLSFPDDWEIREGHIVTLSTDGIKSLQAGIKELMKRGHINRQKIRDARGRFCGWETAVYEQPGLTEMPNTDVGSADVGSTDVREDHATNTDQTNNDKKTNNKTTNGDMLCHAPYAKSDDRSAEQCFPAVMGTDAENIADAAIEIEYGRGGIKNKGALRRHLIKLLADGKLEKPDGWERYWKKKEAAAKRAEIAEAGRQNEAAEELQARKALEDFEKLPAHEQNSYIEKARSKSGHINISPAVLRIVAAHMATGHESEKRYKNMRNTGMILTGETAIRDFIEEE